MPGGEQQEERNEHTGGAHDHPGAVACVAEARSIVRAIVWRTGNVRDLPTNPRA